MTVEAVCIRTCYDSKECRYYERDRTYEVDPAAFKANDLLRHFKLIKDLPIEEAHDAEKRFVADREHEERARKSVRARAAAAG